MTEIQLAESGRGKVAASGLCTVTMGPQVFGSKWNITNTVIASSSAAESSLVMYRNSISLANVLDSTASGNNDTSDTPVTLGTLDKLIFQWSGATPGADCLVSLYGTNDTGRA